jgi:hypothetical protein
VAISEFMAINGHTLADQDNEFSDWIELHNTTNAPVDLSGWHLTDDPGELSKWTFPAVTLGPDGYLVVFASEKNRTSTGPGTQLHTNFKLGGDGEYLALVEPDGATRATEFNPYPPQEADVSYGAGPPGPVVMPLVPTAADAKYLVPTPDGAGGVNGPATGWTGSDPNFDAASWASGQTGLGFAVGQTGPPALPEELEPNDTPATADDATANFLPVEASAAPRRWQLGVKGTLGTVSDADFYSLGPLDAGDVISVSESGSGATRGTLGDCYVELYRLNGGTPLLVTFSDDNGPNLDSLIGRFSLPVADTYLVRAGSFSNSSAGTYDVGVTLEDAPGASTGPVPGAATPVTRETEPNNSAAAANDLAAAWRAVQYHSTTSAAVSSSAAVDYFKFRFTAGDLVSLVVDSKSTLDAAVAITGPTSQQVGSDGGDDGLLPPDAQDAYVLSFIAPATGLYTVRVGSTGGGSSGTYSLELDLSTNTAPPAGAPYVGLIRTNLADVMHDVSASTFVRIPFSYDAGAIEGGPAALTLGVKYDDGFVAYLNGTEVARRNAPGEPGTPPAVDAAATGEHPDAAGSRFENIDLTAFRDLLADGQNVLAVQALNLSAADDDFLILPVLDAATPPVVPEPTYFLNPTPGQPNNNGNAQNQGPQISSVTHVPARPADDQDLLVTAKVSASPNVAVATVTLRYRVNYAVEQSLPMADDGAHGDGAAGDGVYGASIPAAAAAPGQMIRYLVATTDSLGRASRAPLHAKDNSPQYLGTVVQIPSADGSTLPVLHMFAQDPAAIRTRGGGRGEVFYDGEFYDNIRIHDRGGITSDGFKFDFNPGYRFRWSTDPDAGRVDEINVNYNSSFDETRLRAPLAFETFTNAGTPSLASFPLRLQQNGVFFRMATFVEDPDEAYLHRVGLDDAGVGPVYKMNSDDPQMFNAFSFEKKTRTNEGFGDLQEFLNGIHLPGDDKVNYLFDHVDIPAFLNYWAANTIVNDNDDVQKNYLLYRDAFGDGEWQFLPWDKDLTFGKHYGIGDYSARDPQTHPFFGDSGHPKIDGPQAYNYLIDALLDIPAVKQMYQRRLRTVMDDLLQPATTPLAERKFEKRLDELFAQVSGDPQAAAQMPALRTRLNEIRDRYLAVRRNHLYVDHSTNTRYPDFAGIPAAQPGSPPIDIAEVDYNPASGDQGQEYVKLSNPNAVAVDVSGWTLAGGIAYTLPPGVVIPAGGSVYVAKELRDFRARTVGPHGGQGLLAVGGYEGQLSARGETVVLSDASGAPVDSYTYAGDPTPAQRAIRVTEIMYHPADSANGTSDERYEFIELQNVSDAPVSLAGLRFTQGVNTTLADTTLNPGGRAVVVKDRAAFESRYGVGLANVVGTFPDDALNNGGERVRLEDASGEVILDFHYDARSWYPSTDGLGRSLVIRNPGADVGSWGDKAAWRPSGVRNGSPGADDAADTAAPTFDLVEVSPDPRSAPVDSVTLAFSEPVYGLDFSDLLLTLNGLPVALSPAQTLTSADGGRTWTLGNLAGLTNGGGLYRLALSAAGSGIADYGANPLADGGGDADEWRNAGPAAGTVVAGRWAFYNNSAFDGRDPAGTDADLAALAPDKAALRPGQAASAPNVISSVAGITGVLVEFSGVPAATLTADDFVVRTGGPGAWAEGPRPTVTTLSGPAGGAGARYALAWPDRSIRNTWLQVTVPAGARTGLAAADVFYFGALSGEAGDAGPAGTVARVNALDVAAVKRALNTASTLRGALDFNRDGRVNALDVAAVKANLNRTLAAFTAPAAGAPAVALGGAPAQSVFADVPLSDVSASALPRKSTSLWESLQA